MASSNADFLSQYFGNPGAAKSPSNLDVAKYILLNADRSVGTTSKSSGNGGNEPSLMGRIFDILSRPNYAIAEGVRTGSPMGFLEGLAGKKKTTFSDVLEELGVDNRKIQAAGGLGLDIALDPTTYIPGGAIAKGAKALGGVVRGAKTTEEVANVDRTLAQKLMSNGEPINPENLGLPSVESPGIPEALKRPTDPGTLPSSGPSPTTLEPSDFGRQLVEALGRAMTKGKRATEAVPGQMELPFEGMPDNLPKKTVTPDDLPVENALSPEHVPRQIPLRFPDFSVEKIRAQRATDVAEGVAKGDVGDIIRAAPKPKATPDRRDIIDADIVASGFTPARSASKLNKKFPESLNPQQQAKLYNQARDQARARFKNPDTPANAGRVDHIALKIYTAVEKKLEDSGFVPRLASGEDVRLSDVLHEVGNAKEIPAILHEFGSEIKTGSQTWQILQALKARGALVDAPKVKAAVDAVHASATETRASKLLSDAQQTQVEGVLKKIAAASTKGSGGSAAAVKATESLVSDALNAGKSAATIATEQKAHIIDEIVAGGREAAKKRPEVNQAVTRGLEHDLGQIPRWAQNDNKAVEFFMGRVATWWGQRDLRPLSLNAIGSAASTAQARGSALDKLFMPFTQTQRHEALRLAQGIGAPTSDDTYQLATQVKRLMDNMVGQARGQSVIMRSGISMEALNGWMRRFKVGFEFSNKTIKDDLGRVIDYSKGSDWVNSWKSMTPSEDPKIFLFKLQQAMEQASREKALFDEIGERFGQKAPGGGFNNQIDNDYLRGYYFSDDIAKQLPRVIKDWTQGPWQTNNKVLKLYDRVLSMWKSGVTIYRPGHHIRNVIGDVYLGFMDNVISVKPYVLAARVQRVLKDSYSDLMDVDELVKLGVMGRQYGTPMPGEVIFKNKSGVQFTADQIGAVAHQKGLLEHARTLEDIIDLGEGSKFKPFGGRVQAVARGASELQSHNARLAHFIDKVMKSRGSDLETIFEEASRRARKWHPTGLDMTEFERKVMRRIIPFYSWLRKSTPLLIEGMVMNPGKTVIPAKVWGALQTANGVETPNGRADPFPTDQMFPDWIRGEGLGPISTGDGFLGVFSDQMPPGYVMGGMGINPLTQLMSQAQTPGKTILSSLTPVAGIPLELAQGRKTFTGEPIYGPDARPGAFGQYVGEQIPGWSAVQGITGITPFGGDTSKAARSDQAGKEAFFNWLTGLGVRGTGPYVKQARYEKQAPHLAEQKERNKDFLQNLRGQLEQQGY